MNLSGLICQSLWFSDTLTNASSLRFEALLPDIKTKTKAGKEGSRLAWPKKPCAAPAFLTKKRWWRINGANAGRVDQGSRLCSLSSPLSALQHLERDVRVRGVLRWNQELSLVVTLVVTEQAEGAEGGVRVELSDRLDVEYDAVETAAGSEVPCGLQLDVYPLESHRKLVVAVVRELRDRVAVWVERAGTIPPAQRLDKAKMDATFRRELKGEFKGIMQRYWGRVAVTPAAVVGERSAEVVEGAGGEGDAGGGGEGDVDMTGEEEDVAARRGGGGAYHGAQDMSNE